MKNGTCQGKTLFLAAAHRARKLTALINEVVFAEQLLNTCVLLRPGVGVDISNEVEVFPNGQVPVQGEFLRHVADSRL